MKSRVAAGTAALFLLAGALLAQDVRESRKVFLRARTAVADGSYREALDLYRKVIELLPQDAVVRFEYAQLLRDLNVPDESMKQAQEVVRLDPQFVEGHRLLGALELALSERDPSHLDKAISELEAARKLEPGNPAIAAPLARALLAKGRAAEAAKVLEEAGEARAQPAIARIAAEAKAKSGRTKEAEAIYADLLEQSPEDRESAAALIDLYEEDDQLDKALELLAKLEKLDPENPAIPERITLDLARAGRFTDAEKRARDLAAKRPENRAIRRLLAQVLFEKGSSPEGEKILRALIVEDPDDDATRRALTGELMRERRFPEAKTFLEEGVRRAGEDPKKIPARDAATVELGYLAVLQKDFARAQQILSPLAVKQGTVNPRALRILATASREKEDFAGGLEKVRAALAAEPDKTEWAALAAEFQYRAGDRKKAEESLAKLAASQDIDEVLAAADIYARVKDYAAAARVAREASRRFPDSSEALFRLGSALERSGATGEAEKTFQKLLQGRPNDSAAQNYLGYMWADRGIRLDEARELLEKAVAREPRNGAYLDSLGWVYFRLGRLEKAQTYLADAKQREPDDPTIEEHLGDLSERQGDVARAIAHWERALQLKHEEPEKVRQKLARVARKS
ncbi:MAG TPA: tetratricopeptide repeat protein [Thermoanaerobaculia bacterium]|jgi:predicted Zn-dependent protease|nr:tetratricopeptide repeat protein [Thermoanaerobaculia bacterium]